MMRKRKVYLETTMFNYYFDRDRDAHLATVKFFKEIKKEKYDAFTSKYVIDEISKTVGEKKDLMLGLLDSYGIKILEPNRETERLSRLYLDIKAVPEGSVFDANHIAVATIYEMDMILSLNFSHIVRNKTRKLINDVNYENGYKDLAIHSPMEVLDEDS